MLSRVENQDISDTNILLTGVKLGWEIVEVAFDLSVVGFVREFPRI